MGCGVADQGDWQLRFQFDSGREHPLRDMSSSGTGHCYGGIDEKKSKYVPCPEDSGPDLFCPPYRLNATVWSQPQAYIENFLIVLHVRVKFHIFGGTNNLTKACAFAE
eukprot:gene25410-biopygen10598